MLRLLLTLFVGIATFGLLNGEDGSEKPPQQLLGQSFVIFYVQPGKLDVHRGAIIFGAQGATCDIFKGITIPFTGTVKTNQSGSGKNRRIIISEFSAAGKTNARQGGVSFTANKDGNGAKGSVVFTPPGKDPVTITFQGRDPNMPSK